MGFHIFRVDNFLFEMLLWGMFLLFYELSSQLEIKIETFQS